MAENNCRCLADLKSIRPTSTVEKQTWHMTSYDDVSINGRQTEDDSSAIDTIKVPVLGKVGLFYRSVAYR
jgi:hypothetical protein